MEMQKHAMLVVKETIDFINPGQIPLIVGDCHFITNRRNVNWHTLMRSVNQYDFLHGVSAHPNIFTRMWGEPAGWIWLEMDVLHSHRFTPGVAISLLGGKHVKRTCYAYQLTLTWLNTLKLQAYDEYDHDGYGPHEPIKLWERGLISSHNLLLDHSSRLHAYTGCILCHFVHGQWTGDWPLTLKSIEEVCPFFAFGQTNCAWWTPVFLKDMPRLPQIHPTVHEAFMEGKFVVQCYDKKLSMMELDQNHKHSIKFLKEDSGAKGLHGHQQEKEVIKLYNQGHWGSLVSLKVFCINQTQSTGLNIQNHQLLNQISFSNTSKLCVTLSVKLKL